MDRKDFLLKGCALCSVASVITYLDSCSSGNSYYTKFNFTIDLSNSANAALGTVGGYVIQNNAIVIKTSTGYKALSLICTHQGCTVRYVTSQQEFQCPCHGGLYDSNGNVLAGPPPQALQKLNVTQNGNVLTVASQ
jgi:cytochrome b6-f complex iron-sulfur subunit